MIARRRRFTPAMRRRLAECDEKPGMPENVIERQAEAAERRMSVIDRQPEAWRSLLNDYDHRLVATVAEAVGDPKKARRVLEARLGPPVGEP